jgi:hypothetical protein
VSQVFYTTSTGTGTTSSVFGSTGFRVVVVPQMAPPKPPDQVWVEHTTGRVLRGVVEPREAARVRAALEHFGYSPTIPLDPAQARRDYRALARATHPDVGGDEVEFKALSDAWDVLRRRGFVI